MAEGIRPGDFVGYSIGAPSAPAAPTAGFVGLLDFAGYSVGNETAIPPAPTRNAGTAWRRYKYRREEEEIIFLI